MPVKNKLFRYFLYFLAAGLAFIGALLLFVFSGLSGPFPDVDSLKTKRRPLASYVYASDSTVFGKIYRENRSEIPLDDIPVFLKDALIATEDARFYDHSGIDIRSLGRVFFKGILMFSRSAGGGSTISQQLAKNLYPRETYFMLTTPVNKLREFKIARRIEKAYTKDEILELYLNTVSFGEHAYGIGTAARRFFASAPSGLLPQQSATLVGMLKAPTYYSPRRFPERSLMRRNIVIDQMRKYGKIETQYADSLKQLPITLDYTPEERISNLSGYFLSLVRTEVQKVLNGLAGEKENPLRVDEDGLRIYTTLNPDLQKHAEAAVIRQMPGIQKRFDREWGKRGDWETKEWLNREIEALGTYKQLLESGMKKEEALKALQEKVSMSIFSWDEEKKSMEMSVIDSLLYAKRILQSGLLAIDPQTGGIKAWVGGVDHRYFPYDHILSKRQVGSTFKPIVYAAALEAGVDKCKYYNNIRQAYPEFKDWSPKNASGEYGGSYSLEGGLANSVNTVSVQVLMDAGIQRAVDMARRLGIRSDIPAVPSIALGTPSLQLEEITSAYAPFVNGGKRVNPHFLLRIEDNKGNVLYEKADVEYPQVMADSLAEQMVDILSKVVESGTARSLRSSFGLNIPLAGKTGTTQNHTDGWFIGLSPDLITGVWVGADDALVHFKSLSAGQGGATALPVYGQFMKNVLADKDFESWKGHDFYPGNDSLDTSIPCQLFSSLSAEDMTEFMASLEEMKQEEFEKAQNVTFVENVIQSIFKPKDLTPEQEQQELLKEMQKKLDRTVTRMERQGKSPTQIKEALAEIRTKYYARIEALKNPE